MTERSPLGASAYEAALRSILDVLDGAASWELPPAGLEQLIEVLAKAERAVAGRDADGMRQTRGSLVLLSPRLGRLGEPSLAPVPEVPLALIADLVHRIRVDLGMDVPVSDGSIAVEVEGREGGIEAD